MTLPSSIGNVHPSQRDISFEGSLHEWQDKPADRHPEERPGKQTQFPVTFAQTKHLGEAIYSHRYAEQYQPPPAHARQSFPGVEKDETNEKHRAIDGTASFAQADLVSIEIK